MSGSKTERMASDVSTPEGAALAAVRRATVTTAEVWAIPAAWVGRFVRFDAETQDVYIRFGTADTVSVSASSTSSLASAVLTAAGTEPHLIVRAGTFVDERIDAQWTHLAHISDATDGLLAAALKSGDGD